MAQHGRTSSDAADADWPAMLRPGYGAGEAAGYDAGPGAVPTAAGPVVVAPSAFGAEVAGPEVMLPLLSAEQPFAQPPAANAEWITCPECGETSVIDPAQRRAEDFCPHCDFPLFWARSAVVAMAGDATGASLRRLPGTVGRAATAFVACPHCGEPNSPIAVVCVRCGRPMVIEAPDPEPEPEPEPVFEEPEPEPEPEPEFPVGIIIAICLFVVFLAVFLTLGLQYNWF